MLGRTVVNSILSAEHRLRKFAFLDLASGGGGSDKEGHWTGP